MSFVRSVMRSAQSARHGTRRGPRPTIADLFLFAVGRTGRIWSPGNDASEIAFVAIEAVRVSRIVRAIKKVTLSSAAEIFREELLYAKPPATAEPAGAVGRTPQTIVAYPAADQPPLSGIGGMLV
jgi:hypothetical protein